MEDEPLRADITATVDLPTRTAMRPAKARVLITNVEIAFLFDESGELLRQSEPPDIWDAGKHSGVYIELLAVSDLLDISQDVPADTAPDETASLVLAFNSGAMRESVRIEGLIGDLGTFQSGLFRAVFDGTTVTVARESEDGTIDTDPTQATLGVGPHDIRFESDTDALVLSRDDIAGFETVDPSAEDQPQEPIVAIYTNKEDRAVRTDVRLSSFRRVNLFGRYLQTSPDAGSGTAGTDESRRASPSENEPSVDTSTEGEPKPRQSTGDTTETTDAGTAVGTRILLVDDDAGDLEMTEMVLTKRDADLQFVTATSAADGMATLEQQTVDCVVSDYDMPGVDGIEFLQQVRERYPDLPFILFTGQGGEAVAKQAILSDVTDYVEKGIGTQQYDVLLSRIEKAVR